MTIGEGSYRQKMPVDKGGNQLPGEVMGADSLQAMVPVMEEMEELSVMLNDIQHRLIDCYTHIKQLRALDILSDTPQGI